MSKRREYLEHPLCDKHGVFSARDQDELTQCLEQMQKAQQVFAKYSQLEVDALCAAVVGYIENHYASLAKSAADETKVGNTEDKVIKNIYAGSVVFESYKDTKTVDEVSYDSKNGVRHFAAPVGIIAAFVPFTNPTASTIFKSILALKTRNAMFFSPTPNCQNCCYETLQVLTDGLAVAKGPVGIFGVIRNAKEKLSQPLMKHPMINLIFATGGKGMVHHAYSSGKPALGVGSGNVPVIIEDSADIVDALAMIKRSKTFDYGVLCSSEEVMLVQEDIYQDVKAHMMENHSGFWILQDATEAQKVAEVFRDKNGNPRLAAIGKSATIIAETAGIDVPSDTDVLVVERCSAFDPHDAWLREKMAPGLAMIKVKDMDDAIEQAKAILSYNGMGHSVCIHLNQYLTEKQPLLQRIGLELSVGRVTVNQPGCFGTVGGLLNFGVGATMSIGCGTWGGNSTSVNIGPQHLLNYKTLAINTEDVRLARKAVNLFKPPHALIRGAMEMFGVCLELTSMARHSGAKQSEFAELIDCTATSAKFLDALSTDFECIATHQRALCDAMTVYHNKHYHKNRNTLCHEVRMIARYCNLPPGYLLPIFLPYIMKYGGLRSGWNDLDTLIDAPIGNDEVSIAKFIAKICDTLFALDGALPLVSSRHAGLNPLRWERLRSNAKIGLLFITKCIDELSDLATSPVASITKTTSVQKVPRLKPQKSLDAALCRNLAPAVRVKAPKLLQQAAVLSTQDGPRSINVD